MSELHFTRAPDKNELYKVGDHVDVFCDHDVDNERVRDWLEGVVVQVDSKMIAVQFRDSVYLTDGWMVPDHVLWCLKTSALVRHTQIHKRRSPVRAK